MQKKIRLLIPVLEYHLRKATSGLRDKPDFIIMGAQKAGTTSLYGYLKASPNIMMSNIKEVHFFNENYIKGINWYKLHFPFFWERKFVGKKRILCGEATPDYLFHPLVPYRINKLLPNIKLIILLRNPVDRAISHYYHEVRRGRENRSFEQAIKEESIIFNNEIKTICNTNEHHSSKKLSQKSYLSKGLYFQQIERVFQYFNKDDVFIAFSEHFYAETERLVNEVLNFLELPDMKSTRYPIWNKGENKESINSETRDSLNKYFIEPNKKLEQLIEQKIPWQ